ncbi:OPT oligopeptide transporter [Stereum hirsutum FP-91666 SS1]|uniref:OPT oligopeptide transporter n=1 Tax=Stereum hirsutum (strain FP-91666) TaxID=721885 RepID=UPI000444A506|nr:OPT oligopeptide transporter [Stereum hirsutum FP-91666 SS1]EIM85193.1 OPT oligopeptide transporter [Stereum hirsutum FP-91666 SS1]
MTSTASMANIADPPALSYGGHLNISAAEVDVASMRSGAPQEHGEKEKDHETVILEANVEDEKSVTGDVGDNVEDDEEKTLLGTDVPFVSLPRYSQLCWTFGSGLFGSIFGFAIIKPLSRILPERFGGGYFGPKENVCVMSAATAAGSLGLLFASGFPAMYQLGVMGNSPKDDIGRLFTFTICCAYFGIFFTIPLRKFYILRLKLVFPNSVATAYTIRSLHVGKNAAVNARKKTYALLIAFFTAICWRVVSEYAPGIMWDWHWAWWFYRAGWSWIVRAENFSWVIEWTPAFLGVGLLVGFNNSASFLGGSVLSWMVIGPALIATGKAFGTPVSSEYPGYISMMNMVLDDPVNQPSPRYWLIWPGTFILLCASFAEVFCNFSSVFTAIHQMLQPILARLRKSPPPSTDSYIKSNPESEPIYDPAPPHEQVPSWMWVGGMLLATVVTMIVMSTQFNQNAGVTLLAIIFAFLFSLIGAECSGRVSVIPVTSIGNASQLIFGGVSRGRHLSVPDNQRLNSLTGMIALGASEQCADMLGDLKSTHLLGASPRVQLYAQCCGALVSIFMSTGMYVLFSTAYPCINDLEASTTCSFPAPDVASWRAVAVAVSSPTLPIPPSSGYTAIGLGILAVLTTIFKYRFVPPAKRHLVPNWNAIGIAFILNTCTYPIAMFMGSVAGLTWRRFGGASYTMYMFPVAAGMIAGEGLGGIINAVLQIAGVSGSVHGTAVGCPMNVYCG